MSTRPPQVQSTHGAGSFLRHGGRAILRWQAFLAKEATFSLAVIDFALFQRVERLWVALLAEGLSYEQIHSWLTHHASAVRELGFLLLVTYGVVIPFIATSSVSGAVGLLIGQVSILTYLALILLNHLIGCVIIRWAARVRRLLQVMMTPPTRAHTEEGVQ